MTKSKFKSVGLVARLGRGTFCGLLGAALLTGFSSLLPLEGLGPHDCRAADWPTYRHDAARSAVTDEPLQFPLVRQWTLDGPAPRPAWPEPGRELNRLAFDYVYHVAVADGTVFFGSSADHKVYAVDLATGQTRWTFFTEGPVRFAPTVFQRRLLVASDDGCLYCLSVDDGSLLWKFRAGPRDERVLGNEQMISRWPLRAGVAVVDGTVYFAAGMWPSEGVFLYALRPEDGSVVWSNDTLGQQYLPQPHPPSTAMTGVAPQGYLVAAAERLFVPTGRNVPAAFSRTDGRMLYYHSRPTTWGDRWGGSWCALAGGLLFNWRCHVGPDTEPQLGEYQPDPNDGVVAFDPATGQVRRDFPGKLHVVVDGGTLYATGSGSVTAYRFAEWAAGVSAKKCTQWSAPAGRVYELIKAGNTLVLGEADQVAAVDAETGRVLWREKVDGQARGLAVADGRLLVSTTTGDIVCFGPQRPKTAADRTTQKAKKAATGRDETGQLSAAPTDSAAGWVQRLLRSTGKTSGYCLALPAGDGRVLLQLARQSHLTVFTLEPDRERAEQLRRRFDAAGLYGTRLVVHVGTLRSVRYPNYFADLVVWTQSLDGLAAKERSAAGRSAGEATTFPAAELYRVLHPVGGVAYFPVDGPEAARRVQRTLLQAGVPDREVRVEDGAVLVVRGPLPGSDNWTHQYANAAKTGASNDRRVRLPLRVLWFGRPGPARMVSRHWKGPAPLCVDGRFFVIGQESVLAVDAYNGRQLWRRDFAKAGRFPVHVTGSNVVADSQGVYLATGRECLQLDPATGRTVRKFQPPLERFGLTAKQAASLVWSYLSVTDAGLLGSLGTEREGRYFFLLDKQGRVLWTYTAARPVSNNAVCVQGGRVFLLERTDPRRVEAARRRGQSVPDSWQLLALDARTGKRLWQTEQGVAGRSELWSSDGVVLATGGGAMSGYDARTGRLLYHRRVNMRRFPVIVDDTVYAEPVAYDLRTGQPKSRPTGLTGSSTWTFARSYGCGTLSGCPNLLLFRSSTLGILDLAGDTGVHNFGGVRAGCFINAIAAAGLVLAPPADAGCTCSYSFQTTVALEPAEPRERQEDWAVFYTRLPNAELQRVAWNLGAPGDRRDSSGQLWLALPRPDTPQRRRDIALPYRFEFADGFGPFRRNSELRPVGGTDRPWVYTSGLRGLRRAEFDLRLFDRAVTAWPVEQAPRVDGRLDDACWDGYKPIPAGHNTVAWLRYDDHALYVAFQKAGGREGQKTQHEHSKPAGPDGSSSDGSDETDFPVWQEESFECLLSSLPDGRDAPADRCLHVGVSATGRRYDALWVYETPPLPALDLPPCRAQVDGDLSDWNGQGLQVQSLPGPGGTFLAQKDFDPTVRVGWNEKGLLVAVEVQDDSVRGATDRKTLPVSDWVAVYAADEAGRAPAVRVTVSPDGSKPNGVALWADAGKRQRRTKSAKTARQRTVPDVEAAGKRTATGYQVELLVPWSTLGRAGSFRPAPGSTLAVQVVVQDGDAKGERFRALWHPAGTPDRDPNAYQVFRLSAGAGRTVQFQRSRKPDRSGVYSAVSPLPWPVRLPPLGAHGEDASFNAPWRGSVHRDGGRLCGELVIPWKTLSAAGLDRSRLAVCVTGRGPLKQPPTLGQGFERLLVVPRSAAQPQRLRVRLHFAELDGAEPGERVFDVRLQGRTVLKNFDVVAAAGGLNRPAVRQFDVVARRALVVELVPAAQRLTRRTAPVLCGVEFERLPAGDEPTGR